MDLTLEQPDADMRVNPKLANSVLNSDRRGRGNSGFFEEIGKGDWQSECVDEMCTMEEAKEAKPDLNKEQLQEKYNELPYRKCWGKKTTCNAQGTEKCINYNNKRDCECKKGYENLPVDENNKVGSGDCADTDECKKDGCKGCANTACENTEGSFTCKCKQGFEKDPLAVSIKGKCTGCKDKNECAAVPGPCKCKNTVCKNTPGAFGCECKKGYVQGKMNGICHDCEDEDECKDPDACKGENKKCTNTPGSFVCTCVEGSVNVLGVCKKVDIPALPSLEEEPKLNTTTVATNTTTVAANTTTVAATTTTVAANTTTVAATTTTVAATTTTKATTKAPTPAPTTKKVTPKPTTKATTKAHEPSGKICKDDPLSNVEIPDFRPPVFEPIPDFEPVTHPAPPRPVEKENCEDDPILPVEIPHFQPPVYRPRIPEPVVPDEECHDNPIVPEELPRIIPQYNPPRYEPKIEVPVCEGEPIEEVPQIENSFNFQIPYENPVKQAVENCVDNLPDLSWN